mmetsp:Transcript_9003/g.13771  ORF Transcript_9003/g.13771 Transcript_9003/m.13771 type:complete len:84 (+) Transcript_9003:404-655(+)
MELGLYSLACLTGIYLGVSFSAQIFSQSVAVRCFMVPGFLISGMCLYGRVYNLKGIERSIKHIYAPEIKKYEDYLSDDLSEME